MNICYKQTGPTKTSDWQSRVKINHHTDLVEKSSKLSKIMPPKSSSLKLLRDAVQNSPMNYFRYIYLHTNSIKIEALISAMLISMDINAGIGSESVTFL